MSAPVIMDIVVAAILLLFVGVGFQEGFVKSLAGLIITLAALIGAAVFAGTFTEPAMGVLAPVIEQAVEKRVDQTLTEKTGSFDTEAIPGDALRILELIGVDSEVRFSLAESAEKVIADEGVSVVAGVVKSLARSVVYVGLFLLGFIALSILLRILAAAMELLTKLPGLHAMNALAGCGIGLIKGGLIMFLGVFFLRRIGISVDTTEVAQTHLLRFFTTYTPLSVLSLLK